MRRNAYTLGSSSGAARSAASTNALGAGWSGRRTRARRLKPHARLHALSKNSPICREKMVRCSVQQIVAWGPQRRTARHREPQPPDKDPGMANVPRVGFGSTPRSAETALRTRFGTDRTLNRTLLMRSLWSADAASRCVLGLRTPWTGISPKGNGRGPVMADKYRTPGVATEVTIRRACQIDGAIVYVVSDEDGEFARATRIADALHYASDLLHGPGTGPRGTVWNLLRNIEDQR